MPFRDAELGKKCTKHAVFLRMPQRPSLMNTWFFARPPNKWKRRRRRERRNVGASLCEFYATVPFRAAELGKKCAKQAVL